MTLKESEECLERGKGRAKLYDYNHKSKQNKYTPT